MRRWILLLVFSLILFCFQAFAQLRSEGFPPSFDLAQELACPIITLATPDLEKVKREDTEHPGSNRFGVPIEVDLDLDSGSWSSLEKGGRVWRLQLEASNAKGLAGAF